VCPFLLQGKLFLQELWGRNVEWDDELGERECEVWNTIMSDLENITQCSIPRYIGIGSLKPTNRLVCFL